MHWVQFHCGIKEIILQIMKCSIKVKLRLNSDKSPQMCRAGFVMNISVRTSLIAYQSILQIKLKKKKKPAKDH